MFRTLLGGVLLLCAFVAAAYGGGSTAGRTAVDTDISIQTTDIEALDVGSEQQCIERLAKVVDVDYLREHEVTIPDEESATFAIENAISQVCTGIDSDEGVHEAAHEVVHLVEDRLAGG